MKCVWFNTVLFQKVPCVSDTLAWIYSSSHTWSNVSWFYLSTAHSFLLSKRLRNCHFLSSFCSSVIKVNIKVSKGLPVFFNIGIIFLPFSLTSTPYVFYKLQLFATKFTPFSLLFPVLQRLIFTLVFHPHQCQKETANPQFKKKKKLRFYFISIAVCLPLSITQACRLLATLVILNPTFSSFCGP